MGEDILDSAAVADWMTLSGRPMTVSTIHTYHHLGKMPPADLYLGRNPGWYVSTIRKWLEDDAARDRQTLADRAARRDRYKEGT